MISETDSQSEVGIDDLDILVTPPKAERTLAQIVLQAQALLVRQHLVRAGLANVDDRAPRQMPVGDEISWITSARIAARSWTISAQSSSDRRPQTRSGRTGMPPPRTRRPGR
jgi:hypothetical protein